MTKTVVRPPGYPLSASLLLGIVTLWARRTRLYGVVTQTKLQILTTVSSSNPVPKLLRTQTLMEMSHWENRIIQGVPGGMDKTSGECSLC